MKPTIAAVVSVLLLINLAMVDCRAAEIPPASLVRSETWVEHWPNPQGEIEPREVTGEIWNEFLQASLDRDNTVHLPNRGQPYYLDGPVILKSGQSFSADANAEIRLKPGSNTCMVRNEQLAGFADRPVPPDLQRDTNITIEGGIWTTLANGAPDANGNRRGASAKQSPVHGTHGVILLHNADHVTIRNVTIRQCQAFGIHLGNVEHFVVDGVTLDQQRRDGVHLSGPACDGLIRSVTGDSHDDNVSLTAWDWSNCAPSYGPIHHVTIEGITGSPLEKHAADAIRLLPGVKRFADGTLLECPLHDITLRNIADIRDFKLYDQPNLELGRDNDASAALGTLENIRFEHLVFNRPGSIQIHANTNGLIVRDVRFNFPLRSKDRLIEIGPKSQTYKHKPDDPSTWVEIFSPDRDCRVSHLELSDVKCQGSSDVLPTEPLIHVIQQSINADYPRTLPRGGTGRGVLVP